ncbi:MAG: LamG-like jellyroll fold domain-containing protein [Planctomycetota bacterium]
MTPQQRQLLIDSLLEGEISAADFLRLEAELSVDPAARKEYYERIALSVLLEVDAVAFDSEAGPMTVKKAPVSTRRWRRAFFAMALATVALLAVILGPLNPLSHRTNKPAQKETTVISAPVESQASGFAVVAGQTAAVWSGTQALPDGALVPPGTLHLASGIVQLKLFSGVVLVIEGYAEFSLLSPLEMSLARGKVRVTVPEPAHGFLIHTDEGDVVDLGTEFAMQVADGHSEVHVLEGDVEWRPRAHEMQRMEKGQALRWSADGREAEFAASERDFIGTTELHNQLKSALKAKHEAWREYSETLRRDPRLVALYRMDVGDDSKRRLPNQAVGREVAAGGGAVVAAARSTDRWGHAGGALDFSPTGSRVRLSIPGEYGSLTLLCWVKINTLDRWYNSLFLTDGHDLHEPHWQIMNDGRLFFSVKKREDADRAKGEHDKHIFFSPPFWSSELSGQWLMIATAYDIDSRVVTHYLNGEVLSREAIPEEYLVETVRIGNASIGNWGLPAYRKEREFAVRNFNGSMDEFALFSAALSAQEIKELYERGKP